MARRISFINYKGGVGKTSTIVNVAACLAKIGRKVLLIDLDAQSNSSIWLMKLERWNQLNVDGRGSLFSIFDPGTARLKDLIVRDVVINRENQQILPGLDLIPTTFNLIDVEHEYNPPSDEPVYSRFWNQLAEIESQYDFILFDCPPNVMRASQCGLFSSGEVVIPANPDALSLIGFTLLTGKLLQFNERSAGFRTSGMGKPAMIRDAIVVRRAVTLGLPVVCIGNTQGTEGVLDDYKAVTRQILQHDPKEAVQIEN